MKSVFVENDTVRGRVMVKYFSLPHYRVPLFDLIQQRGEFDLSVYFTPVASTKGRPTGIDPSEAESFSFERKEVSAHSVLGSRFYYQKGVVRAVAEKPWAALVAQISIYDLSSLRCVLRARRRKIPVVIWSKGLAADSIRNPLVNRLVFRKIFSWADVLLPYGDASVRYFRAIGIPDDRIVPCYNTVDVEGIAARREPLHSRGNEILAGLGVETEGKLVISTVGGLVRKKRVDDLIRACARLRDLGVDFICLIGGRGPERGSLEALVAELGLQNSVRFLGMVPEEDDNAIYAVSDAVVFCGGVGLGLLQPMALRVPVVGVREESPDGEMLVDGRTGWTYPARDATALAQTLAKVRAGDPAAAAIIAGAEREVLEKRTLSNYADSFIRAVELAGEKVGERRENRLAEE